MSWKLISYQIVNGELTLNVKAKVDFDTEFAGDFFRRSGDKIKRIAQRLVQRNQIPFSQGSVRLLVNGVLVGTFMLGTGASVAHNPAPITLAQPTEPQVVEVVAPSQPEIELVLPESALPPPALKEMQFMLLAGHGTRSSDPGAVYNNRYECEYAQALVDGISQAISKRDDVRIKIITEPAPVALSGEMALLKSHDVDYALSIHFNAGGGSGTEVIVPHRATDFTLAQTIIDEFKAFGQPIRPTPLFSQANGKKTPRQHGVKVSAATDYFGIIRTGSEKNIHSEILEVEFIDNEKNMQFYDANQALYVKAITHSIVNYYQTVFLD